MKSLNHQSLSRNDTIELLIGIVSTIIGIILIWSSYNYQLMIEAKYEFAYITEIVWFNYHQEIDYLFGLWLSPLIFGVILICDSLAPLPEFDFKQYFKWKIKEGIKEYKKWRS